VCIYIYIYSERGADARRKENKKEERRKKLKTKKKVEKWS
jgi:hypothetical protein